MSSSSSSDKKKTKGVDEKTLEGGFRGVFREREGDEERKGRGRSGRKVRRREGEEEDYRAQFSIMYILVILLLLHICSIQILRFLN